MPNARGRVRGGRTGLLLSTVSVLFSATSYDDELQYVGPVCQRVFEVLLLGAVVVFGFGNPEDVWALSRRRWACPTTTAPNAQVGFTGVITLADMYMHMYM